MNNNQYTSLNESIRFLGEQVGSPSIMAGPGSKPPPPNVHPNKKKREYEFTTPEEFDDLPLDVQISYILLVLAIQQVYV